MDEKEYSLKRIPKHQEVAKSTKDNFFGFGLIKT